MDQDYYSKYVEELNKLYESDPKKAVKYLSASVDRVTNNKPLIEKLGLDDKKIDIIITVICALLSVLATFICSSGFENAVGIVFYIAGLMIGIFVPFFGLIFLCSHGGTGLYFMCQDVFEIIKSNPIMEDLSFSMRNYLYGVIFVYAIAIVLTLLHSVVPKMREVKYIKGIISFLYLLGLILVRLIPYKLGVSSIFPLFG